MILTLDNKLLCCGSNRYIQQLDLNKLLYCGTCSNKSFFIFMSILIGKSYYKHTTHNTNGGCRLIVDVATLITLFTRYTNFHVLPVSYSNKTASIGTISWPWM